jgi:hypothetical protein
MESYRNVNGTVFSSINAPENREYGTTTGYLSGNFMIVDRVSESFRKAEEFIDILRQHGGRYDLKKIFTDEKEVCFPYDLITLIVTVFVCLCHKDKRGKIVTIQLVFGPRAFVYKPIRGGD